MSLNRISYTGVGSDDINVKSIEISDNLYYVRKDFNQLGTFLTCYEEGRATFLNLPKITNYEFALVGFDALPYANGDHLLTLLADGECIDPDNIVTSGFGNVNSLQINKAGTYLITYKITRTTNGKLLKTSLLKNAIPNPLPIPGTSGSIPFSTSETNDQSVTISKIVRGLVIGDILKVKITVFSDPVGGDLTLAPPIVGFPHSGSEKALSFISLIRIGN